MGRHLRAVLALLEQYNGVTSYAGDKTFKGQDGYYLDHSRWHAEHGSGHPDPTVWFHGTRHTFNRFKQPTKSGSATQHVDSLLGIHFAHTPDVTDHFTDKGYNSLSDLKTQEAPRVIPARLSIQNPRYFDSEDDLNALALATALHSKVVHPSEVQEWANELCNDSGDEDDQFKGHIPTEDELHEATYEDPEYTAENFKDSAGDILNKGIKWSDPLVDPYGKEGYSRYNPQTGGYDNAGQNHPRLVQVARALRRHLQSQGHDGVTYRNDVEGGIGAIAFSPDQIHEAYGHGDATRRFADWFDEVSRSYAEEGEYAKHPETYHLDEAKHRYIRNDANLKAVQTLSGYGYAVHDDLTGKAAKVLDYDADSNPLRRHDEGPPRRWDDPTVLQTAQDVGGSLAQLYLHGHQDGIRVSHAALALLAPTGIPSLDFSVAGRRSAFIDCLVELSDKLPPEQKTGATLPTPTGMTEDEHVAALMRIHGDGSGNRLKVMQLATKPPEDYTEATDWLKKVGLFPEGRISSNPEAIQHCADLLEQILPPEHAEAWVKEAVNNSVSEGGLVSDADFHDRLLKTSTLTSDLAQTFGVQPGQWEQHLQDKRNRETLWDEARGGAKDLEGAQDWTQGGTLSAFTEPDPSVHDTTDDYNAAKFHRDFIAGKPEIIHDVARYYENDQPRAVLGQGLDDIGKSLDSGAYMPGRYRSFGTDKQRIMREDAMGIGRVAYSALGWEAPLPPKVDMLTLNAIVTGEKRRDGVTFGCEGYGGVGSGDGARLSFHIPEQTSHAVDDTYYDCRYDPTGGSKALLYNGLAFAARQQDHSRAANPTNDPFLHNTMPSFLELHTPALSTVNLTHMAMYHGLDPEDLTPGEPLDRLLKKVVRHTAANVIITPTSRYFYHPDTAIAGQHWDAGADNGSGGKGLWLPNGNIGNILSKNGVAPPSEAEISRETQKAIDTLQKRYGNRVRLQPSQWFIDNHGNPYG